VFARRTETETGGAARGAVKRDADADLLLETDAAAAAAAAAAAVCGDDDQQQTIHSVVSFPN